MTSTFFDDVSSNSQNVVEYESSVLNTLTNIAATSIVASRDLNNNAYDLLIGASSNVNIEALENIKLYVDGDSSVQFFNSSLSNNVRTDTNILDIYSSNATTYMTTSNQRLQISGMDSNITTQIASAIIESSNSITYLYTPSQELQVFGGDSNATTMISSTTFANSNNYQLLTSSQSLGLQITNSVQLNSNLIVTSDITGYDNLAVCGNMYAPNINLYRNIAPNASNNYQNQVAYGFHINEYEQLEILKYNQYGTSNGDPSSYRIMKMIAFGENVQTLIGDPSAYTAMNEFNGIVGVGSGSSNNNASGVTSGITNMLWSANPDKSRIYYNYSNVGINNPDPRYWLDVNGDIHSSKRILVQSNLGVGTLNPQAALHVVGSSIFEGDIIPAGNGIYNLGSATNRFNTCYISAHTLDMGTSQIHADESGSIVFSDSNGHPQNISTNSVVISNSNATFLIQMDDNNNLYAYRSNSDGLTPVSVVQNVYISGSNTGINNPNPASSLDVIGEINLAGDMHISSNLTISGNLTVTGSNFIANVKTIQIEDNIMLLNNGEIGAGVSFSNGAGIEIDRGSLSNYRLVFKEDTQMFEMGLGGEEEIIASQPYVGSNALWKSSNLSDLTNVLAAANNIGLGTTCNVHFNNAQLNNIQFSGTLNNQTFVNGDFGSNLAVASSNYLYPSLIATSNLSYNTSNNLYPIVESSSNAAMFSSNAAVYSSNAAVSASNTAISASNNAFTTSNEVYPVAFGASNIAASASNVAFDTSNAVYPVVFSANSAAIYSSNAAVSASNTAVSASNTAFATSNAVYPVAFSASNAAVSASNTAISASNVAFATSNAIYPVAFSANSAALYSSNAAVSASNTAISASNVAFATSNEVYPVVFSANIAAISASNTAFATSNIIYPMATNASNVAIYSSNVAVSASNTAISASNVAFATSNVVYPQALFASNVAVSGSNTANAALTLASTTSNYLYPQTAFASNAGLFGSNLVVATSNILYPMSVYASNTAYYSSNQVLADSNVLYPKSIFASNLAPIIDFASNTAIYSSNTIISILYPQASFTSNTAISASNAGFFASNTAVSASNAGFYASNLSVSSSALASTTSNTLYPQALFASNVAVAGSNNAYTAYTIAAFSSNVGVYGSNLANNVNITAQWSSNAADFGSNIGSATSNILYPVMKWTSNAAGLSLSKINNLSDVTNVTQAQNNLGLGSQCNVTFSDITVSGNILPTMNLTQNIGSSNMRFNNMWVNDLHLGSNTLYIGNTPFLGTSNQTININSDSNQNICISTNGTGHTQVISQAGVDISATNGLAVITSSNGGIQLNSTGPNQSIGLTSTGANSKVSIYADNEIDLTCANTVISGNALVSSNLTVSGNFTVNGTNFTTNAVTVQVKDNIMRLNYGQTGTGVSSPYGAGIEIDRGDAPMYRMVFKESAGLFQMGTSGSEINIASENYVSTNSLFKTNNLSELTNTNNARNNIGLGSTCNVTFNSVSTSDVILSTINSIAFVNGTFGSNLAVATSALATTTSNVLYPQALFASNVAVSGSALATIASNTANAAFTLATTTSTLATTTSNALYPQALFASNVAVSGSALATIASNTANAAFTLATTTSNVLYPQALFASNVAVSASNTANSALTLASVASNSLVTFSNTLYPQALFASNVSVSSSNTANSAYTIAVYSSNLVISESNSLHPQALFASNVAVYASNNAYAVNNTALFGSNLAIWSSNTAYFASNVAVSASNTANTANAASTLGTTTSNTLYPQAFFASNVAVSASNTAYSANNAALFGSNLAIWSSNTAYFSSNTAVSACNSMISTSNRIKSIGWSNIGSNIVIMGSNIGINNSNPQNQLDIIGDMSVKGSLQLNNTVSIRGLIIQASDGSMGNITSTSVNGFSNNSNGIAISMPSNTSNNAFNFVASNSTIARLTGNGNLSTTGNITAPVIRFGGMATTATSTSIPLLSPGSRASPVTISTPGVLYFVQLGLGDANFNANYLVSVTNSGSYAITTLYQGAYLTLTAFSVSGTTATVTVNNTVGFAGYTTGYALITTIC